MEAVMNANYAALNLANKNIIDEMIEFLFVRQSRNEEETLAAMRDADEGRTIGPFNTIAELTEALDADD